MSHQSELPFEPRLGIPAVRGDINLLLLLLLRQKSMQRHRLQIGTHQMWTAELTVRAPDDSSG